MHQNLDFKDEVEQEEFIRDIEDSLLKQRLKDEKETLRDIEEFQLNEFIEHNDIWVTNENELNYARERFHDFLMER